MPAGEDTSAAPGPDPAEMRRTSRDPDRLRAQLAGWLSGRLPPGSTPQVLDSESTSANGMSSETVLFTAEWSEGRARRTEGLVARIAPDPADAPVFPTYDLRRQYDVMGRAGERAGVPVPVTRWFEPDLAVLGQPFFVMDRVEGLVPPDVMPYPFGDNWLHDASPADQRRLQDATVSVLARLHDLDPSGPSFDFLAFDDPGDSPLRRHVAHARAWYRYAAACGTRSPLIERAFGWLDDHWPSREGRAVVSWGDARIGNVMYGDFEPVAVLDWEMAGIGPRELDLAWLVYSHCCFQDIAAGFDLPGMPGFLRYDDVAGTYESLTGHAPSDLAFYGTYAAVQWGIVFLRTGQRAVRFGEREMPDDVDDLLMNRAAIESMLAGDYWSERG